MSINKYFNKITLDNLSLELAGKFMYVWIKENVERDYERRPKSILNDNEYILYSCWRQVNDEWLYRHYTMRVVSGSMGRSDKLIFHGGCIGCISQEINNIDRCKGCQYFRANWNKKDLCLREE